MENVIGIHPNIRPIHQNIQLPNPVYTVCIESIEDYRVFSDDFEKLTKRRIEILNLLKSKGQSIIFRDPDDLRSEQSVILNESEHSDLIELLYELSEVEPKWTATKSALEDYAGELKGKLALGATIAGFVGAAIYIIWR